MDLLGKTITSKIETLPLELQNTCRATIVAIEQLSAQSVNIDQFCEGLVETLHRLFNLFSANLYTVDAKNGWVILKVGTSEIARAAQRAGHRLPFDDTSLVGRVAKSKQGIISLVQRQDQIQYESVIFPPVHSELAMPIIVDHNSTAVGVLDIQSEKYDTFGEDHYTAFSIIATCIALVFEEALPNEYLL